MPRASRLLALSFAFVLAASGCRPGTALGNRYNNVRAYYNTFYNAERALEEGELSLERSAVRVDRAELVPVFPVAAASGTSGPFQEAIDKSAELLRNRPTSKWADDALLLIGKAYFYQRNVVGAEQKFRETIAAAALSDDRRLADEARFWLGRTYASADRFDDGVVVLEEGLAGDDGDRRWTTRMRLALGELYARAGRWDEAAESLQAGAPLERDPDIAARAFVLLGQVEEHAGRFSEAAEAYDQALRQRPAYELAFAAEIDRALVLALDADDPDAGLSIVRSMRSNDKHYDRRADLALAEARIRAAAGETAAALTLYRSVLYDEALAGGTVRGPTHYRLGQFYRDQLNDYVRASAHFDTAATSVREPAADVRSARGAIVGLADEARIYGGLATSARRLAEVDSLLVLGTLSEDDFRTRIDEIEAGRRRVFLDEQRRLEEVRRAQAFSGTGGAVVRNRTAPQVESQTQPNGAAGFLSFRDPASLQAGLIAFQQRWGDRPLVPGWRFKASIQAGAVASGRGVVGNGIRGGQTLEAGPPPLDLSAIPRTPAKRDEMVAELAGLRYELANAFFLSLGRADTAAALYRSVLADAPGSPTATRARYALAEIERAAGRDEAARPLYQAVAEVDSAALGRASRLRLGLEVETPDVEPEAATSDAYRAARRRWREGETTAAAYDLVAFADADPDHPDAPRAYLGAAVALIDAGRADPTLLAISLPDSLVSRVLLAVADSLVEATPPSVGPREPARPDASLVDGGEEGVSEPETERPAPPRPADGPPQPVAPQPVAPQPVDVPAPIEPAPVAPDSTVSSPPAAADLAPAPVAPDSSATPQDDMIETRLAPVDSTSFTLWHHLSALSARYPGTPAAERASVLVGMLPAPARIPTLGAPDTLLAGLPDPDPLSVDLLAPDSLAAGPVPDPTEAGDPDPAPPVVPSPAVDASELTGLRGGALPDPTSGGFSWSVRTVTLAAEAEALVDVLADAGFRAGLFRNTETDRLSVLLGQFDTEEDAEAARPGLPAWARIRGTIVALSGYASAANGTNR